MRIRFVCFVVNAFAAVLPPPIPVLNPVLFGTNFVMTWDSRAGSVYVVEAATDLDDWLTLGMVNGNGGTIGWTDTTSGTGKVYRVSLVQFLPATETNVVFGSVQNYADPRLKGQVIGGGGWDEAGRLVSNFVASTGGAVHSGAGNRVEANAEMATIQGGERNEIRNGSWSGFIGGGRRNILGGDCDESVIAGGWYNYMSNTADSFIAGGAWNSVVGVGFFPANRRSGILGGESNSISESYSLAGGRAVNIKHPGCFVWNDARAIPHTTTGSNQFRVRAGGGIFLDGALNVASFNLPTNGSGLIAQNTTLWLNVNGVNYMISAERTTNTP